MTDWTDGEIAKLRGDLNINEPVIEPTYLDDANSSPIDWRTKGAVTPVKNQGHCGSCWTFSTTGAMESHHFIQTGKLISLSESQLVDCDTLSHGCNGGNKATAMKWTTTHPLETEADYPYVAQDRPCNYNAKKGIVKATKVVAVPKNDPVQFKAALAKGPVSVSIDASSSLFHHYSGGIITSTDCGIHTNHAVLVVGWAHNSKVGDYYIVKNSWGKGYGRKGYVRIKITDGVGLCAINSKPYYPVTN